MSFFINLLSGNVSEEGAADAQSLGSDRSSEDVRRKRLERLAMENTGSTNNVPCDKDDGLPVPPVNSSSADPASSPGTMSLMPPPIPSVQSTPIRSTSSETSTSNYRKTTAEPLFISRDLSPFVPGSAERFITAPSPSSNLSRQAVALSLALEQIFLFSLRPDVGAVSDSGHNILYLGAEQFSPKLKNSRGSSFNEDTMGSPTRVKAQITEAVLLNPDNVNELIAKRLDGSVEAVGGAISYLASCYKRLMARESTAIADIKESLGKCKKTIVSYTSTALVMPDIFGRNSENSVSDLFSFLSTADDPSAGYFLKDLAEELNGQDTLEQVAGELMEQYEAKIIALPTHPQQYRGSSGKSIMDNLPPLLHALLALCKFDKRLAREVALSRTFALSTDASQPPPPTMFNFAMALPRAGAALESTTLLGRLLSFNAVIGDPALIELFKASPTTHHQQQIFDSNISFLRARLTNLQVICADIVTQLLKASGPAKDATMLWLVQSIEENAENDKDQPRPHIASTRSFMLNLNSVFLALCRPFMSQPEKLKKVDWKYLCAKEAEMIVTNSPRLLSASVMAAASAPEGEFNFMTKVMFLCWRSLHLGLVPLSRDYNNLGRQIQYHYEQLQSNEPQALFEYRIFQSMTVGLLSPQLLVDTVEFCIAASTVLLSAMEEDTARIYTASLLPASTLSPAQQAVLSALPEDFMDDLLTLLLFVSKFQSQLFNAANMQPVFSLVLFFLRRPWAMQSPHLRAKLGKVLHSCFLPRSERSNIEFNERAHVPDGQHSLLLASLPESQFHLAPTMLLLYGDVEHTGFYEKITNRRYISTVLRYLWSVTAHRPAFRRIVTGGSPQNNHASADDTGVLEQNYFLSFANGVLNEINAQFVEMQQHLGTIKAVQSKQNSPEWGSMTEEQRTQDKEKLQEAEERLKPSAGLTREVLGMVNYLSSDEVIRRSFIMDELLPRFTSMLMVVLANLTGPKSMQFKLADANTLGFEPKIFLIEVCQIITHVADFDEFCQAVIVDGFFNGGVPLAQALKTVTAHNLVSIAERALLQTFTDRVKALAVESEGLKRLLDLAPMEFMDGITDTIMKDPVRLPSSGAIVDRSTVATIMLNDGLGKSQFEAANLLNSYYITKHCLIMSFNPFFILCRSVQSCSVDHGCSCT